MGRRVQRLRIIGGDWRGRKIAIPPGPGLRPTADRTRETLFNWLQARVPGSRCLDLFAGSGALGLEALSRGAGQVTFLERDARAARALRDTLDCLEPDSRRAVVRQGDALAFLRRAPEPVDLAFLDPPFAGDLLAPACALLAKGGWLRPGARIYLEADRHRGLPRDLPTNWRIERQATAGDVVYALAAAD